MSLCGPIELQQSTVRKTPKECRTFLLVAPLLFALYALLTPPFQAFDENQHVFRAWQISNFQWVGERRGAQSGGVLPIGLGEAALKEIGSLVPQGERHVKVHPLAEIVSRETPVGSERRGQYYNFYGSVVYPPVIYVPQVGAVWIGTASGFSVESTVRLGRLINAAICIALIYWALALMPFGRRVMMIIALLPPTAAGAASFGQDGLMIGASFMLIAAGLDAAVKRRWTARSIAITASAGVLVTISKIVYLPLVAIAAFPRPRSSPLGSWLVVPVLTGLAATTLLFTWLRIVSPGLVPTMRPWVPGMTEQVHRIVAQPADFLAVIGRTYLLWLPRSWATLYSFGDSTISTVWPAALAGTGSLFITMIEGDPDAAELTRTRRAWMLLIFASIGMLIATAMFLALAPRGAATVEGIQARYFLPALPLVAIALMRRGGPVPKWAVPAAFALLLVAHAASLEAILTTFYSF